MVSLFLVPIPSSRAVLRPSSKPIDASFAKTPYALEPDQSEPKGSLGLFVDGRDNGIRVPKGYEVKLASNVKGDLAGSIEYTFDGSYSGTVFRTFVKPLGMPCRLLPLPKGHDSLELLDLNARGQILTLATEYYFGPGVDDPFYGLSHAILWTGQRTDDLGVAQEASLAPDGSVQGSLWVDRSGKPVNGIMQGVPGWHRVRFQWRNGRRSVYQA